MASEIQACGDKAINEIETDIKEEIQPDEIVKKCDILKELEELKKITFEDKQKILSLEQKLKEHVEETTKLKTLNAKLIEENTELHKNQTQNISESQEINNLKKQSEELLTRAKGVIFEKTKVCKNQELQIEALTQQITSLKEVVAITKDLLEIRNVELKHLTDKLECMDDKIKAEKERHQLMHCKMEKMMEMNVELKNEYQTQLRLFSELREKYQERDQAKNKVDTLRAECNNKNEQ